MIANTIIKKLKLEDCTSDLLINFNRYQKVKRCWRKENGKWQLKDIAFVENWDIKRKNEIVQEFIQCIKMGGIVICAFAYDKLVGFASISNKLFGKNNDYIRLEMLHISFEFRNNGIGKELFEKICHETKKLNVRKLYITAHSSEETQAFYKSLGCYETVELNQVLYDEEPYDCHLEYII